MDDVMHLIGYHHGRPPRVGLAGANVGLFVGVRVGIFVGVREGGRTGARVGLIVGLRVGGLTGALVGALTGALVGLLQLLGGACCRLGVPPVGQELLQGTENLYPIFLLRSLEGLHSEGTSKSGWPSN